MPSFVPRLIGWKWQREERREVANESLERRLGHAQDYSHAYFTSLWNSCNVHVHYLPAKLLLMLICQHVHENESWLTYQTLCQCSCMCCLCLFSAESFSILVLLIMPRCAYTNEAYCNRPVCPSVFVCPSSLFPLRCANAEAVKCLYRYRTILARFRFKQNSESRFSLWVMAWIAHPDARCKRSKVKRRSNSPQQIAFQLDIHIYATGQASTQVKTWKRDCRRLAAICSYAVQQQQ